MKKQKILECLATALNKDVSEIADLPVITPLEQMGFDSINFIQFIVLVEEAFGFTINDSDLLLSNFETPGAIYNILSEYVGAYDEQ